MNLEDNFNTILRTIIGLGVLLVAVGVVGPYLPPTVGGVVGVICLIVLLAGLGSTILSVFLGGDGFDHLGAGFVLALVGFIVVHFGFGWTLDNPYFVLEAEVRSSAGSSGTSGPLAASGGGIMVIFFGTMIKDVFVVAVGMAIVAIPMLPVILKLQKSSPEKPAPPVPPSRSPAPNNPPAKGGA